MAFSESLTVRILGDSSQLRDELNQVTTEIDQLQSRLAHAAGSTDKLSQAFSRLASASAPLQRISALLTRIDQQLKSLSQQPITLNVAPAIAALQQLLATAQMVARMLQTLPTGPGPRGPAGPGIGGSRPTGGGGNGASGGSTRTRGFASGGYVTGPTGIDRVQTSLTAGEFVLNTDAVQTLGLSFLERLNQAPVSTVAAFGNRSATPLTAEPRIVPTSPQIAVSPFTEMSQAAPQSSQQLNTTHQASPQPAFQHTPSHREHPAFDAIAQTTNTFGDITIQVQELGDVEMLFRDLQAQGIHLRHRRG